MEAARSYETLVPIYQFFLVISIAEGEDAIAVSKFWCPIIHCSTVNSPNHPHAALIYCLKVQYTENYQQIFSIYS
jgi:hypothetical protein